MNSSILVSWFISRVLSAPATLNYLLFAQWNFPFISFMPLYIPFLCLICPWIFFSVPQDYTYISWLSDSTQMSLPMQCFPFLPRKMSYSPSFGLNSTYTHHFASQLMFCMPILAIVWSQKKRITSLNTQCPEHSRSSVKACGMVWVIKWMSANNKLPYVTSSVLGSVSETGLWQRTALMKVTASTWNLHSAVGT